MCRHKWVVIKRGKKVERKKYYTPKIKYVMDIERICVKCEKIQHRSGLWDRKIYNHSWNNGRLNHYFWKSEDIEVVSSFEDALKQYQSKNEINYCPLCGADIHRQRDCGCGFKVKNKKMGSGWCTIPNVVASLVTGFGLSLIIIAPFLLLLLVGVGWFDIFCIWVIDYIILFIICLILCKQIGSEG